MPTRLATFTLEAKPPTASRVPSWSISPTIAVSKKLKKLFYINLKNIFQFHKMGEKKTD